MVLPSIEKLAEARIPTEFGSFRLHLYHDDSNRDHVALVLGNIAGLDGVLTRVHSECFTAEVLGSLRCDCAGQLRLALAQIAEAGAGVLIYLRQEGRGIGLLDKLRAYNLQDLGHDTVDANLLLGHASDERTYHSAAYILEDLQVRSIRLLTNNPSKVDGLRELGVNVQFRSPLISSVHPENSRYLDTKIRRMHHQIDLEKAPVADFIRRNGSKPVAPDPLVEIGRKIQNFPARKGRPFVTLSYAQSLDGCITGRSGEALALSGPETLILAHRLRAAHDSIIVGIGTVLSDDPQLTVRRAPGRNPEPVVLDSHLRIPLDCRLLSTGDGTLRVAAVAGNGTDRQKVLESHGVTVIRTPGTQEGMVDIQQLLATLPELGITSVMVEGGVRVIKSFIDARLVDFVVVTMAPRFVGGDLSVRLQSQLLMGPRLNQFQHCRFGEDLVLWGEPVWE